MTDIKESKEVSFRYKDIKIDFYEDNEPLIVAGDKQPYAITVTDSNFTFTESLLSSEDLDKLIIMLVRARRVQSTSLPKELDLLA